MSVRFSYVDLSTEKNIYHLLHKMLPEQGCIEFQRDSANKAHTWHQHENSETLLIIEGGLEFFYEEKTQTCNPGDIIYLPSMIRHQSIASVKGCTYAIATQLIDLA
ncbi:cupin domain-containing protein [Erwinia sp. HDF1-3R]|uniref:cupin domain-containing protein n=1 Tax=Erwinia sp. HDF1-3R TaxID=3141543 RepID=UPI0031F48E9A